MKPPPVLPAFVSWGRAADFSHPARPASWGSANCHPAKDLILSSSLIFPVGRFHRPFRRFTATAMGPHSGMGWAGVITDSFANTLCSRPSWEHVHKQL